jgi:acyl carrier protein
LKEWAEFYSPTEIRLINMFGITETTVHVTFHQITPGDIHAPGKSSPIGKPLPETTVYVLNEHLEPVPVGIPGQLYVGGSGVSKGYLHKDALTRERFIENPHKAGEIIYKTGDLGKWLPGGSLEYLDRMDNQIQLRGYRVELGEIDYHLLKHEEIDEALTIARTDIRGEKYLCSYLVSREKLTAPALREDLAGKLPDYMIPSHFFQLDAIPLNSSGKPDLNGLQTYGRPLEAGEDYIAPESEIEKKIADIWKEVIQVEKTGVNDNFFEIGGNSLNIVQVKSKLKDVFGIDIPIAVMFEYPTIRSFVHYLEQQKNGEAWQEKEIEDIDSKQDEAIMVIEETMQLIDEGEND